MVVLHTATWILMCVQSSGSKHSFFSILYSLWCHRKWISFIWPSHAHSSGCWHRSTTNLWFKPQVPGASSQKKSDFTNFIFSLMSRSHCWLLLHVPLSIKRIPNIQQIFFHMLPALLKVKLSCEFLNTLYKHTSVCCVSGCFSNIKKAD